MNRNIIIIILVLLTIYFKINSTINEVSSNRAHCTENVCTITSTSATNKIITKTSINLDDIKYFSYEKNNKISRKRRIVYDFYAYKYNGERFKIGEVPRKTPYELDNIVQKFENVLKNKDTAEIIF